MTTQVQRKEIFSREKVFTTQGTPWCMGCGYGALARIMVEELHRLKPERAIGVVDVACLEAIKPMLDIDMIQGLHGRAVSIAKGVKIAVPEALVMAFQGDGGMLNEGLNEILHLGASGHSVCVIMGNNGVLGDTGGQATVAAPIGLKTVTTPGGRNAKTHGSPIPIAQMLALLPGTAYVARGSTHDPAYAYRLQKMIRKALQVVQANAGLAFVEVLSTCPTGWNMSSVEAAVWQGENILPQSPVGVLKDWNPAGAEVTEDASTPA